MLGFGRRVRRIIITDYIPVVSTGLIEDREEADEVLEENGANRKAPTGTEKNDLFFFLVQMP